MKKVTIIAALAVFTMSITSCEPETSKQELLDEQSIDKEEIEEDDI